MIAYAGRRFNRRVSNQAHPEAVFALIEGLCWFGQSLNAVAWTYYESGPGPVQDAMAESLRELAPADLANCYVRGMTGEKGEYGAGAADRWIGANWGGVNSRLRKLARELRALLLELTGSA
jgi:hypothetical protein